MFGYMTELDSIDCTKTCTLNAQGMFFYSLSKVAFSNLSNLFQFRHNQKPFVLIYLIYYGNDAYYRP